MGISEDYQFCPGDMCIRFISTDLYETYLLLEELPPPSIGSSYNWKILRLSDEMIVELSSSYCATYWFLLDDPEIVMYLKHSFQKEKE
jgi:hypothetical protein